MIPVVWAIFLCPQLSSFQPDKFTINRIKHSSYIKVKTKKAQSQIADQVSLPVFSNLLSLCFSSRQWSISRSFASWIVWWPVLSQYKDIISQHHCRSNSWFFIRFQYTLLVVLCLSKMNMYETEKKAVHSNYLGLELWGVPMFRFSLNYYNERRNGSICLTLRLHEPRFVWKPSRSVKIMCCVVVKANDCVGFSLNVYSLPIIVIKTQCWQSKSNQGWSFFNAKSSANARN